MAKPCRKDLRLKGWDYSSNASYHVTICSAEKKPVFGSVIYKEDGAYASLTDVGAVCKRVIDEMSGHEAGFTIDNYVIMPNHVHLLLSLSDGCNLGNVVNALKSQVTKGARKIDKDLVVWQRSYHEHVIRGEADYQSTWKYIDANPAKWAEDELYIR